MSINRRLILGSVVFALLATIFAVFSFQLQLSTLDEANSLFSNGVDPLNRMQVAEGKADAVQSRLAAKFQDQDPDMSGILAGAAVSDFLDTIGSISSDVEEVLQADLSPVARNAASGLLVPLEQLQASGGLISRRMALREIATIRRGLGQVANGIKSNLESRKAEAVRTIEKARNRNLLGFAAILVAFAVFSWMLNKAVRTPLRRVSRLANELAEGRLEAPIVAHGPQEVRDVCDALRGMQDHCNDLEDMLGARLDAMSLSLDAKTTQLTAALDNMSQALCMLDAQRRVVLCNPLFTQIFGDIPAGAPASRFLKDPRFVPVLAEGQTTSFLIEGVKDLVLEARLRGMPSKGLLVTVEDVTQRLEISQRLEHLANFDTLTDLPNRVTFGATLNDLLVTSRRGLAVAIVDIRNFKSINKTFGHPVGDAILRECGVRLRNVVGQTASVYRLGSNDFSIILPSVNSSKDVENLADRVIKEMERPFDIDGRHITITVSIGLVYMESSKKKNDLDAEIVLQNCDLALYQAKQEPGSSFSQFRSDMRDKQQQRRDMELDLQSALRNDQMELYYQPFVDAGRRRVSGFEALMRWHHPERGMISPALFIPLAEENGQIEHLGRWAIETACMQAASWPSDLTVSVNLSGKQFKSRTLVDDLRRSLRTSGLDPSRLQIEVTESLFLDEDDTVLSILKEFRRLGLRISMDDFGTGYSSLGYLSRFPFDKIKIDQTFVRDLTRAENIAIVRSIIGLSGALGMRVIAEGIETSEQMQILLAEGCREMQGFFFSKPRPAGDLAQMLAEISNRWSSDSPLMLEASVAA